MATQKNASENKTVAQLPSLRSEWRVLQRRGHPTPKVTPTLKVNPYRGGGEEGCIHYLPCPRHRSINLAYSQTEEETGWGGVVELHVSIHYCTPDDTFYDSSPTKSVWFGGVISTSTSRGGNLDTTSD